MTLRLTAPEIFLEETKHTFEGDVYALGMTILEIFTGSPPYEGLLDVAVTKRLMQRAHPERPLRHIPIGDKSSDLLWEAITSCWHMVPQKRPAALQVRDKLNAIIKVQKLPRGISLSVNMSPYEIFECLVAHGAHDLTDEIGPTTVSLSQRPDLGGLQQYYERWVTGRTRAGVGVFLGPASDLYPFTFSGADEVATATLASYAHVLATQICEAVAYLHGINIVHGAINPWNILVSTDCTIQLSATVGSQGASLSLGQIEFWSLGVLAVVTQGIFRGYIAPSDI
ncbi:unnamed protein product [Rhizoctonia solani]|uniref:Protein kinase domain-containing protein n=1 Tax=Rhizoctonia solani TaxID=456999 RepID=A0A8H2W8X7_9AGAM|nr:unnamed protein product [Rhizoctonia solani]